MARGIGKRGALGLCVALLTLGGLASPSVAVNRPPPGPGIVCNIDPGAHVSDFLVEPRRCPILPYDASFAEGANLAKLKWRGWGRGKQAKFRGISKGWHLPYANIRVRGKAYRLRKNKCGPFKLYTRVKVRSRYGTGIYKPDTCMSYD